MSNTPAITKKKLTKVKLHPKLLGAIYIILGLLGLAFAGYSILHTPMDIMPLFGTVISDVFLGILSIFVIIYGYRVMRKESR